MLTLLLILLIIFNVIDIVSTRLGLAHEHTVELNPFLAWTMKKIGILPALLAHKSVFLGVVIALYITNILGWWGTLLFLLVVNAIYVFIIYNNLLWLHRLGEDLFKHK
jgi:hypothetical protein